MTFEVQERTNVPNYYCIHNGAEVAIGRKRSFMTLQYGSPDKTVSDVASNVLPLFRIICNYCKADLGRIREFLNGRLFIKSGYAALETSVSSLLVLDGLPLEPDRSKIESFRSLQLRSRGSERSLPCRFSVEFDLPETVSLDF